MTKFLDLDALPTRKLGKTIKLKGVRHDMVPMGVGQFLETQKIAEQIAVTGDFADQFETVVAQILSVFPTIPRADLLELDLDKLNAVFEFLTMADAPKAEDVAAAGEPAAPARTASKSSTSASSSAG
ncbi:hypothetical protein [Azospirillum argentinense]|uniref:hypothetical protein n=1 Tax=Azospirillum argentinense TaxID=2970906 RepID=UPI0032DF0C8F